MTSDTSRQSSSYTDLLSAAKQKGFTVIPNEDDTGWLVVVPQRPRVPQHTQGDFKTPERAWMAAASLAMEH